MGSISWQPKAREFRDPFKGADPQSCLTQREAEEAGRLSLGAKANRGLRLGTAIVGVVLVFWSGVALAQIPFGIEPPPLIRFTGALFPVEGEVHAGFHTLTVSFKEKRWIFRLDKVEPLTSSVPGWTILQHLFPPEVRFIGPEDLINLLQEPEIVGKRLTIKGRLYIRARTLIVTAVKEIERRPKPTKPAGIL
jgi:hypothetical protein